jgi:hypothetical protein
MSAAFISFDVMEARHLMTDAIDWLEAHPDQHIGGDLIRKRSTDLPTYRVPDPSQEDKYCYCFLGRVAQEARNQHPQRTYGIEASALARSITSGLGASQMAAFETNDTSLRGERAPSLWKRLMIALGRRTPHENTKTITSLRKFVAVHYAAKATKELLS